MRSSRLSVLAFASVVAAACGGEPASLDTTLQPVWSNGDFETDVIGATPSGWAVGNHQNPAITDLRPNPQTLASLNLANGGTAMTTIVGGAPESQLDPDLGTLGTLRFPKYGQRATRLNYGSVSANGRNANVNTLKQTMTVSLGDVDPVDGKVHVRFAVAPILENPGHTFTQQPYYFVRLQNLTSNTTIYQDFNASGQPGVPWKNFTNPAGNAAQYTDWQLVDVSPGNALLAVGDQVELTVIAAGCSLGGHWGRVYVDAVGSGVPGLYAWGTGPQQANSGSDITYTLNYKNGGTTTTTGTQLDFVTPPNTTFQSVSLGAACTRPAVGATGTVSCPVGSLANGSTGSLQVTVHVPAATANGTVILNGNYSIYATGVSALIGPKVFTTVTSSVSYADLGVTISDGVAALDWGQATQYAIDVTNAGPVDAPTATITDTMPSQLTGVTWTCTSSGGATCPASGSGSMNHAVALPIGGQLHYLVSATIIAGTGSGQVVHTVRVTAGGAVSDPDTTNNTALDTNAIGTPRTLTVTKGGLTTAGTISSAPSSISCGTGCTADSAEYLDGSQVVLSAAPIAGATFVGWGGACSGTQATCTVTMTGDQSVTATFVGAPAAVAIAGGGSQATAVTTAFPSVLAVLVTDAGGRAVPGVSVGFTKPASGATATVAASAITGASGVAFVAATANATPGGYSVTATVTGLVPVTFALSNLGAPASIAVVSGAGQSATVDAAFAPLVAIVRDSASQPLPGVAVTITRPGAGASAVIATSATTGAGGTISVAATANPIAGGYAVTAAVTGVATPASFGLTNLAGPAATLTIVGASTRSATVATSIGTLIVAATDVHGNAVSGVVIGFAAPPTGPRASFGATSPTDGLGRSSVVATAGTEAGSYAITASASGLASVAYAVTNLVGAAATVAVVSGTPQSVTVATAFAPLVVRVSDQHGNPVVATVGFAAPASGARASVTATATSGTDGLAIASATAGTIAGSYPITATVTSLAPVAFALRNLAGAPATIAIESGDDQHATVDAAFAAAIVLIVTDQYGNPVPSAPITAIAPTTGATAIVDAPATTDIDGRVRVTAIAGTVTGPYQLTVAVAGVEPAIVALTNDAGAPATVAVVSGADQRATVAIAFGSPLVAIVRDSHGNVVPNASVAFTAPSAGARATLAPATIVTGSDGRATTVATAGTIAGSYAVTAAIPGASAAFALRNDAGAPASIAIESGDDQHAIVDAAFAAAIVLIVTDEYGNPVPSAPITAIAPLAGATAIVDAPATTDASGRVRVTAIAGTVTGPYQLTIAVAGLEPAIVALTNDAGAPATVAIVDGGDQRAVVETAFAAPLRVRVEDAHGNPAPDVTVGFVAPAGGATAIVAATAITDPDGVAQRGVVAGSIAGSYAVVATVTGAAAPVAFALTNTPAAPATVAIVGGDPQDTIVATGFAAPLTVVVRDHAGNPVPGATVIFTAPASAPTAALATSSVVTDADGEAATVATADDRAGDYLVTADIGAGPPVAFRLGNRADVPARITAALASSPQATTVLEAFVEPLAVVVEDRFGNPAPGATVTWAAPPAGATARLVGATAITDELGAASQLATASAVAGSYIATAAVDGVADPASFALTNLAGPPTTVAITGRAIQTAEVDTDFAEPLEVQVLDADGNAVPNAAVIFTASTDPITATLTASSVATDVDGVAAVDAHASLVAGAHTVTAVVAGAAAPVTFALTNTAGAPTAIRAAATSTPQRAEVGTPYAQSLVAQVTDRFDNGVPGTTVEYAVPAAGATGVLAAATDVTDADGRTAIALIAGTTAGAFEALATVDGVDEPARFALTNQHGPAHLVIALGDGAQATIVATAFAAPIVARVVDGFGNPVVGEVVTFAAPGAGPTAIVADAIVVSGVDGVVATAVTAGTITGGYQVTATSALGAAPAGFALRNLAGAPTAVTAVPGSTPQSAEVRRGFAAPLAVIVTDGFGNRVPDVDVEFFATVGPGAALSAAHATTDAAGGAQVHATADDVSGSHQVTAAVIAAGVSATFALTNTASAPGRVMIVRGAGQHALATTAYAAPLVFRVVDGLGNPVPDIALAMTQTTAGATISSVPRSDAAGEVAVTLTAGPIVGAFAIEAHAEGASQRASAGFTVDAIPTTITTTAPVGAAIDQPVTITVTVAAAIGTPAGQVEIVDDGDRVLGTATLVDGRADVTVPLAALGAHRLAARYPAQGSYAASRSSELIVDGLADLGTLSGGAGCSAGGSGGAGLLLVMLAAVVALRRRRLPRGLGLGALAVVAVLVPAAPAAAQPSGAHAVDRFHAASADSAWFALDSLSFAGHAATTLAMTWDYASHPLVAYDADGTERTVVVDHAVIGQAGASVSILDRLRLSATVPMAVYQDGDDATYNGMTLAGPRFAFGDVRLAGDVRVVGRAGSPLRIGVGLRLTTPSGSRTHYLSDGELGVEPRAMIAASHGRIELAAEVGAYLRRQSTLGGLGFGSELRYAASIGARLLDRRLLVGPELIGATALARDTATGHPTELGGGAHYAVGRDRALVLGVGATAGVVNAIGTPDLRVFASVAWAP